MQMNVRQFIRFWLPVIAWMLVIFGASTDLMSAEHTSRFIGPFLRWLVPDISPATIAGVQLIVRKAAHITEYAILAALLARAFCRGHEKTLVRYALLVLLISLAWAATDEYHQTFVASRTGSPIDVMIDAIGAFVGLGIYRLWSRRRISPA